jgi:hypothetical protein
MGEPKPGHPVSRPTVIRSLSGDPLEFTVKQLRPIVRIRQVARRLRDLRSQLDATEDVPPLRWVEAASFSRP